MNDPAREKIIARFRDQLDEIRDIFASVDYWNQHVRKAGEPRVNADPDGFLERQEKAIQTLLDEDPGCGPIRFPKPVP